MTAPTSKSRTLPHNPAAAPAVAAEAKPSAGVAAASVPEAAPTMVNGQYVGDKSLHGDKWVVDPAKVVPAARPLDIFDRIGLATPSEALRKVLEEIARAAGMTYDNSQEQPAAKSTPSVRSDADAAQ